MLKKWQSKQEVLSRKTNNFKKSVEKLLSEPRTRHIMLKQEEKTRNIVPSQFQGHANAHF